jgi:hypothetical protein
VVWIGNERIEYFSLTIDGDVATIGELRRGTRQSASTPEDRVIRRYIGNGSTSVFETGDVGTVGVKVDGVALRNGVDYATSGTSVTLTTPPAAGAFVLVSATSGVRHRAGTTVFDGTDLFRPFMPVDERAGDIYAEPLRSIISS